MRPTRTGPLHENCELRRSVAALSTALNPAIRRDSRKSIEFELGLSTIGTATARKPKPHPHSKMCDLRSWEDRSNSAWLLPKSRRETAKVASVVPILGQASKRGSPVPSFTHEPLNAGRDTLEWPKYATAQVLDWFLRQTKCLLLRQMPIRWAFNQGGRFIGRRSSTTRPSQQSKSVERLGREVTSALHRRVLPAGRRAPMLEKLP